MRRARLLIASFRRRHDTGRARLEKVRNRPSGREHRKGRAHARLRRELRHGQRDPDAHDRVLILRAEVAAYFDPPRAEGVSALGEVDEELRGAGGRGGGALGHRLAGCVDQREVIVERVNAHITERGI